MKTTRQALFLAAAFTAAFSAFAADTPSCVSQNANARIVWTAPAGEPVRSVRAYFRSDAATAEHFVELRRSGTSWSGVLPKVSPAAQAIEYRIATAAADGKFSTRRDGRISVSPACSAKALDASEQQLAKALIVGVTEEGPAVPAGFRCDGIIGQFTTKGALRSYAACSEIAAASKKPADTPQVADASATASKDAAAPKTAAARTVSAPRVATTEGVVASETRDPRSPNGGGLDFTGKPRVSNPRP